MRESSAAIPPRRPGQVLTARASIQTPCCWDVGSSAKRACKTMYTPPFIRDSPCPAIFSCTRPPSICAGDFVAAVGSFNCCGFGPCRVLPSKKRLWVLVYRLLALFDPAGPAEDLSGRVVDDLDDLRGGSEIQTASDFVTRIWCAMSSRPYRMMAAV